MPMQKAFSCFLIFSNILLSKNNYDTVSKAGIQTTFVIPAQAGIQTTSVIPAQAGIQNISG
jgi:hypothetical protein